MTGWLQVNKDKPLRKRGLVSLFGFQDSAEFDRLPSVGVAARRVREGYSGSEVRPADSLDDCPPVAVQDVVAVCAGVGGSKAEEFVQDAYGKTYKLHSG